MRLVTRLKIIQKRLLSYLKTDWDLDDYPIQVSHLRVPKSSGVPDQARPVEWLISIPLWLEMMGFGSTEQEAWTQVYQKFHDYKTQGRQLPRPGTLGPVKIASRTKIDRHERLAAEFFRTILDADYTQALITDQSSLWHFTADEDRVKQKIREVYAVDIEDICNGNLASIFERIEQAQNART